MQQRLWMAIGIVIFFGAIGWAFYPKPLLVDVANVEVGRFERRIEESGKTRLRDRFVVSAPVAGRLARSRLREGDTVLAGQVVAIIWPAPPPLLDERKRQEQTEQVAAAEAGVARATASLNKAELALTQAAADLQRHESLAARGFISSTQVENSRLTTQQRQRETDVARQDKRAADHQLAQVRVALQRARVRDLKQQALSVVAPAAGKVIKLRQQSEAVVAAGMPLLEMGDPAALEVVVELLSEDAAQIKPGMRAILSNWGGTGDLQARVRLIEPAAFTKISALGVEEQRVNVILDLTSPPEQWATLGDNFKADVSIAVQSAEQVTLVPVGALFPQGSRSALFVLDAGRARLHEVELVARNGSVAWIKTTLKPGTQVINYPPSVLLDGTRVTATTASVARNE